MKLFLAQFSFGRIALHVICLAKDHKWHWHALGIAREFTFRLW